MLTNAFYNMTTSKKPPVIRIDRGHGGVQITFTDDKADELEIILDPETISRMIDRLKALFQ